MSCVTAVVVVVIDQKQVGKLVCLVITLPL